MKSNPLKTCVNNYKATTYLIKYSQKFSMDNGNHLARIISGCTIKEEMEMKFSIGHAIGMRRGTAAVEFALVAPLFLLLVFGILDFGRLFYVQETLQHALREAGRFAVTGQHSGTNRVTAIM